MARSLNLLKTRISKFTATAVIAAAAISGTTQPSLAAYTEDAPEQPAPLVPMDAFAALPLVTSLKLSPNGEYMSYITEAANRRFGVVAAVDGSNTFAVPISDEASISRLIWANDEYLLASYHYTTQRTEFGTRRSDETRLASFNIKNKKLTWIVRNREGSRFTPQIQDTIMHILPDQKDHILLSIDSDLDGRAEVRRINIKTGYFKEYGNGNLWVQRWYADQNGDVRLGLGHDNDGEFYGYVIDSKGKHHSLRNAEWAQTFSVLGFSEDPDVIYASARNQDGLKGVYKINIITGETIEEVFTHKKVDIDGLSYHPETDLPVGVSFTTHMDYTNYFDADMKSMYFGLKKAIGGTVQILSKFKDKDVYLVHASSDRTPGAYYLYDRTAGTFSLLVERYAGIKANEMAPTKAVDIPVRDGTTIPGYLTVPLGHTGAGPTVIMPHGGPWSRSTADWDFIVQFLANRGYTVLQPNYRGSTGYGRKFETDGYLQWGGLMQDDVTDATKWMIEAGYAEKGKICIAGGSYGGYAALMGAVQHSDMYACASSLNGVANLPTLKKTDLFTRFASERYLDQIGLEGADTDSVSPYHRAEEINIPVMLFTAKDDTRVHFGQSRQLAGKLEDLGKPVRYTLVEEGGHSILSKEARMMYLSDLEAFLEENIGAPRKATLASK